MLCLMMTNDVSRLEWRISDVVHSHCLPGVNVKNTMAYLLLDWRTKATGVYLIQRQQPTLIGGFRKIGGHGAGLLSGFARQNLTRYSTEPISKDSQ